ncbi:unnamed protein product [Spirodela intermedia]|uniref:Uncharacterized protein n=1 Tax=Spirodela intermedia TaxID=51605 RepID=A0A7I8ILF1_SPIIN|nr:unnamed protein product [Spirodela intermedia]CAA6658704.1 unnamed protein product [Spirodela intermedia]
MGSSARRINVEKAVALGDDLIAVLNMKRESDSLMECLEGAETLRCCHRRIEVCKQQIDGAKNETVSDEEFERLQNELEKEIGDLESKRISIENQRADMKRKEKDELRMQNMLCMSTQVTRIIPDLDDRVGISGYIVDSEKNKFEKFQFESTPPHSRPATSCGRCSNHEHDVLPL